VLALAASASLIAAACGGNDDDDDSSGASTAPAATSADTDGPAATSEGSGPAATSGDDTGDTTGDTESTEPAGGGSTEPAATQTASKEATVKIGGVFSQSGTFAAFDLPSSQGLQMAVDDFNEAGGVVIDDTRYTFDLKLIDLASDPAAAAAATQELITDFGAKIIFGPAYSAEAEPVVGAVQRAGDVMMLSVATKMDSFVGQGTPLFRLTSPDGTLAEGYVQVVADRYPEIKKVAGVFIDDAITRQLFDVWTPIFNEHGIEVTQQELFPADSTNLVPVLQRVSEDNDALFMGYTDAAGTNIINAANEVGLPPIFLARGPGGVPGVEAGDKAELYMWGILVDDPLHPSTPETDAFYADFEERYSTTRDANSTFVLNYYPYVGFLGEAMARAASVDDVEAIAEGLRGQDYENVITVGFDAEGINTTPIKVGIVENGEVTVVTPGE
jgi:branched-chain amino acid transport system substrate-binding protein